LNYGIGEIMLIKNKRFGVGEGMKYCSVEEAKKLQLYDLDLSLFYQELEPFIEDNDTAIGLSKWSF
jgi:hypothetical protein